MAGSGVIRGLHMNHYVVASNDEHVNQRHQYHNQHYHQMSRVPSLLDPEPAPSNEFIEAMVIDDRRKSCARTATEDVGYLCGCISSTVDDAEVVYVERKNMTPKDTHVSKQMNYSEHREDTSTARYSGYNSPIIDDLEFRDEGLEVKMEDLKKFSPHMGCTSAANVVDLLMPNYRTRGSEYVDEKKSKEINANQHVDSKDRKKVRYDEWKKRMLDAVKAPSFVDNMRVAEGYTHIDAADASVILSQHTHKITEQPDFKSANSFQPHYQNIQYKHEYHDGRQQTPSFEESDVEISKHRDKETTRRNGRFRSDGSVFSLDSVSKRTMDYREVMVNQKFNDVMRIASPRVNMNFSSTQHGFVAPRLSNPHWSNNVMSSIDLAHLPSSPMGMNGSYIMSNTNASQQDGNAPNHYGPHGNNQVIRGNNNTHFHHGFNRNSNYSFSSPTSPGWTVGSDNEPYILNTRNILPSSVLACNAKNEEETLLDEMKMQSAIMEADLLRMKESMSPRIQPLHHHVVESTSPSGNGILRPCSNHNADRSANQYQSL